MKFLREVANMVKQSPQDVDHVQQVDVSRMLTGSLAASAMVCFDWKGVLSTARERFFFRTPLSPSRQHR